MKIFKLPDLGEGLAEAEISQWYIKVGDTVAVDQPLASMETAKAVVDVPSPRAGVIAKLYGNPGDVIATGAPLVEFTEGKEDAATRADSGTVVGNIESSGTVITEDFTIGTVARGSNTVKATPAVRNLAHKLAVDLSLVTPTGAMGVISTEDVEKFHRSRAATTLDKSFEPLHGVRKQMVKSMTQSHQEVVAVTIVDDADIHAWPAQSDITVRLIQAIVAACKAEPALNAWYDATHIARKLQSTVNLGLAVDTADGLFVPVIKDVTQLDAPALRQQINSVKQKVQTREITPAELSGATITLSNFGNFAGRYANPIIVPPMVAIVGVGRLREQVVAHQGKMEIHKIIPISLTFDHRAVTGGEATRFLKVLLQTLQES